MSILNNKYLKFLLYVGGTIQVIIMVVGTIISLAVFGIIGYVFYALLHG